MSSLRKFLLTIAMILLAVAADLMHWLDAPRVDAVSTPWSEQHYWGIELKNCRINYLGGLTKQVKFHICNPSGVVWAMG